MIVEGIGTAKVTDNAYKYNGKELNEDLGLNLSDYGARWYDAALGRWWSVDPMGDGTANLSTYCYVGNNPTILIDPTGMYSEAYSFAYESSSVNVVDKMKAQLEKIREKNVESNQSVINVLSASKNSDDLVDGSIGHLINYLLDGGINAKVKFTRSREKFDISKINSSDAVAVVGNKKSTTVDFIFNNLDKGYLSENYKSILKGSYLESDASTNPENGDGFGGNGWGYVVAVTVNPYGDDSGIVTKNYGIGTFEEATAFFILHGLGHLGGLGHGRGHNNFGFMSEGLRIRNEINSLNGDLRTLIRNTVVDSHNVMDSIYKRFPNLNVKEP